MKRLSLAGAALLLVALMVACVTSHAAYAPNASGGIDPVTMAGIEQSNALQEEATRAQFQAQMANDAANAAAAQASQDAANAAAASAAAAAAQ